MPFRLFCNQQIKAVRNMIILNIVLTSSIVNYIIIPTNKVDLRGPRSNKLFQSRQIEIYWMSNLLFIGGTCCLENQICDLSSEVCLDHDPGLQFNKNLAHKFVVYSFISYCLPGLNLTSWDCFWCNEVPKVDIITTAADADSDTYAFVGLNSAEKLIVVSFRGTCDYENIMTDTNFIKTRPYPNNPSLEVHLGFYNAYSSISSTILKGVTEVCYNILIPILR